MTITEFYYYYAKMNKIRIRPLNLSEYINEASEVKEMIAKILPKKKKNHLLYTYYIISEKYPFLNFDDLATTLQCTKANAIILSKKIKVWINTYDDVKTDIEFITFKLNQYANYKRLQP